MIKFLICFLTGIKPLTNLQWPMGHQLITTVVAGFVALDTFYEMSEGAEMALFT